MNRSFILVICLVLCSAISRAQHIFSENFDSTKLRSQWQIVSGNWHRADVQELRIAPAEYGREFVLRSDSSGYVRLFIDLPPSSKGKKLQLKFAYYSYPKGIAPRAEAEFYKKEMKDGIRGKALEWKLPVKGMWAYITKTLVVPADANQFRVVFSNPRSSPAGRAPCLDVVTVSLL